MVVSIILPNNRNNAIFYYNYKKHIKRPSPLPHPSLNIPRNNLLPNPPPQPKPRPSIAGSLPTRRKLNPLTHGLLLRLKHTPIPDLESSHEHKANDEDREGDPRVGLGFAEGGDFLFGGGAGAGLGDGGGAGFDRVGVGVPGYGCGEGAGCADVGCEGCWGVLRGGFG